MNAQRFGSVHETGASCSLQEISYHEVGAKFGREVKSLHNNGDQAHVVHLDVKLACPDQGVMYQREEIEFVCFDAIEADAVAPPLQRRSNATNHSVSMSSRYSMSSKDLVPLPSILFMDIGTCRAEKARHYRAAGGERHTRGGVKEHVGPLLLSPARPVFRAPRRCPRGSCGSAPRSRATRAPRLARRGSPSTQLPASRGEWEGEGVQTTVAFCKVTAVYKPRQRNLSPEGSTPSSLAAWVIAIAKPEFSVLSSL